MRRIFKSSIHSIRTTACLAAAALLLACAANSADGGLQPIDIPDQGVARHNPNPQQAYRITMTIHDAPGPFGIVRGYAQYDVANKDACGDINAMTGTASRMTRLEPFALTKKSDTEYEAVVYADLMQDDDYYGRGVCHWELVMARVALKASASEKDFEFLATIDAPEIESEKRTVSWYWKGAYPNNPDMEVKKVFYGRKRDQFNRSDDELFQVSMSSEEIMK